MSFQKWWDEESPVYGSDYDLAKKAWEAALRDAAKIQGEPQKGTQEADGQQKRATS